LFSAYLRQPYAFHLQRNSAELTRNALNETNMFAQTVIMAGLGFVVEILVLLGISCLMLIVEPLGTLLLVSFIGLASWGFNRLTRQRIARWGVTRQLHEGRRIQHLQQGLGGTKDVKLLGREEEFLSQFRQHDEGFTRVAARYATIGQLPRLWLEFLAITGLAVLVLVVLWRGHSPETLVPTLGLFAVGAFRLLPSANRLMNAVQNIRYGLPVIAVLHSELALLQDISLREGGHLLPFRDSLQLEDVVFRYPSTDTDTIRGITLQIARGTSVGFIGSTGTGKTTLVDIMLGLLTPNSGRVLVDGVDIRDRERGWQDQIGYVPQSIFLTDDSLRRNIAFGLASEQIDEAAVWRTVRTAQLETFVNELPDGLDTIVGERGVRLSGGQRQRIGIARALYHDPSVIVLDEATSALDSATERGFMETVRALRGTKTIIIIAHRLSTVEQCDRLFRLDQGRVVEEGEAAVVLKTLRDSSALAASPAEPDHVVHSSPS
jgi:ABC-type multidrug transport system fused ATPase/permease subunit